MTAVIFANLRGTLCTAVNVAKNEIYCINRCAKSSKGVS